MAYIAAQVTLVTGGTAYSLATLLRAIVADCPGECSQLTIEADAANTASSTIAIGDASVSTSRYGFKLGVGDAKVYDSRVNKNTGGNVPLASIYLLPSGNGLKLNVEVIP